MDIKVPELQGMMGKATISAIYVNEGDAVVRDQTLFDVDFDKEVLEVVATTAGVVHSFSAKQGDLAISDQVVMQLREKVAGEQTTSEQ
ncbi:biotin/lipoyl-containing protein [Pseudoalteromonas rhizosphaerae]|uniref:biotin/lipoyl-containing protein n=1 Tax=Pseudoalteromonas rhizosphaerae TaxID=2518973 RepID=UPI00384C0968